MTTTTNPQWWNDTHLTGWDRVKEAMKRDWDQTKADLSGDKKGHEINQSASDTVKQAAGKEPLPPAHVANASVKTARARDWNTDEPAARYGYGAAMHYGDYKAWDDRTEGVLEKEWSNLKTGETWHDVKEAVRRGWQKARA